MVTVRERNKAVVHSLTLQAPTASQGARLDAIRKSAQQFAKVVVKNTESGPESTLAQRHIEDATMRAVRSVLFEVAGPDSSDTPAPVKTAARKVTVAAKKTVKRKTA